MSVLASLSFHCEVNRLFDAIADFNASNGYSSIREYCEASSYLTPEAFLGYIQSIVPSNSL